jgi:hypothetical protein
VLSYHRSGAPIKPGNFIEDVLGQQQLAATRSAGADTGAISEESHAAYGTWLLDDHPGAIIAHINGRSFLPPTVRARVKLWSQSPAVYHRDTGQEGHELCDIIEQALLYEHG